VRERETEREKETTIRSIENRMRDKPRVSGSTEKGKVCSLLEFWVKFHRRGYM
jgi:hypothetical protein